MQESRSAIVHARCAACGANQSGIAFSSAPSSKYSLTRNPGRGATLGHVIDERDSLSFALFI
jgi:hypothetical protein